MSGQQGNPSSFSDSTQPFSSAVIYSGTIVFYASTYELNKYWEASYSDSMIARVNKRKLVVHNITGQQEALKSSHPWMYLIFALGQDWSKKQKYFERSRKL